MTKRDTIIRVAYGVRKTEGVHLAATPIDLEGLEPLNSCLGHNSDNKWRISINMVN